MSDQPRWQWPPRTGLLHNHRLDPSYLTYEARLERLIREMERYVLEPPRAYASRTIIYARMRDGSLRDADHWVQIMQSRVLHIAGPGFSYTSRGQSLAWFKSASAEEVASAFAYGWRCCGHVCKANNPEWTAQLEAIRQTYARLAGDDRPVDTGMLLYAARDALKAFEPLINHAEPDNDAVRAVQALRDRVEAQKYPL